MAAIGQKTVQIHRATSADLQVLLELVSEYWAFEGIGGYDASRVEPPLRRLLGDARLGAAWLSGSDGSPTGYLLAVYVFSLEHSGLTAEIDEFFVRPGCRGSGTGATLLEAAETEFKRVGCTNVSLQVGRGNEGARRFYVRRGYAPRSGFELLEKPL
ncbi:MAG TPA: GNAT family N-acetyltransferase [Woeseiaceae bacterium]|nr:GNAT family N-acetyltransferase [Woeseiaceae bacterium]